MIDNIKLNFIQTYSDSSICYIDSSGLLRGKWTNH